jgi:hypothetical protein
MPRNHLSDLNNHLFEALEHINDNELEGEELEMAIRQTRAITGVASQIIANGQLVLAAQKFKDEALNADVTVPAMLEGGDR